MARLRRRALGRRRYHGHRDAVGVPTVGWPITLNWDVGLSAWIVQDGNYSDFEVGQIAEFALEFWLPEGVAPQASSGEVSADNVGDCAYDAVAEVLLQTDRLTVLDLGVHVYQYASFRQLIVPRSRV